MTPQPHDPHVPPTDAAVRALYLQAQDQVSAGTTARLNRARHAALSAAPPARRGWAWPLAAGCTALLALAAGLQISAPPASDPASAQAVASAPLTLAEDAMLDDAAADAYVAYDESPDFYLWLAANEATLLAVE